MSYINIDLVCARYARSQTPKFETISPIVYLGSFGIRTTKLPTVRDCDLAPRRSYVGRYQHYQAHTFLYSQRNGFTTVRTKYIMCVCIICWYSQFSSRSQRHEAK